MTFFAGLLDDQQSDAEHDHPTAGADRKRPRDRVQDLSTPDRTPGTEGVHA